MAFANVETMEGVYFVLPRSGKLIWNYIREVGAVETWRKIASRLQERNRNHRFQSFGIGKVAEGSWEGRFSPDDLVVFFAPGSPACVERVVVPDILIDHARDEEIARLESDHLLFLPNPTVSVPDASWWPRVSAWSEYSGYTFDPADAPAIAQGLHDFAKEIDWHQSEKLAIGTPTPIREIHSTLGTFVAPRSKRKRAILFGYGHYAKTNILPNVRSFMDVEAVHEIDPIQVPKDWGNVPCWDSSPIPRETEDYDVYFLAGYHHTHAPLAALALEKGAYAVTEKPIAVTDDQLAELLRVMEGARGGIFACFHKRYSPLNEFARMDLAQEPGAPINYNCIVYEVPLPTMHWYRWPNSKSRLISNGCHWIDHFLFLNDYSEVASMNVGLSPDGTINCSVTLGNGAYFTMVLTDVGSQRIGLQDYVELRAGAVTVKVANNSQYFSEDRIRVLRRTRVNKTLPYKLMYRSIAAKIANDEVGDSLTSVRISSGLILELERLLTLESKAMKARRPSAE
jgi:predicted dehydrogenase